MPSAAASVRCAGRRTPGGTVPSVMSSASAAISRSDARDPGAGSARRGDHGDAWRTLTTMSQDTLTTLHIVSQAGRRWKESSLISAASAAGIAIVALGMVLTPGPNMMYLVSRSLSQGWRAGMISLLGTVAGFLVYLTLASLGLAEVFRTARWLYWAVRLAGAAYLLYLAWQA